MGQYQLDIILLILHIQILYYNYDYLEMMIY